MATIEIDTVKAFIAAINRADVEQLANLMAVDHIFIDSSGRAELGGERMMAGWQSYFRMFPDYKIEVERILQDRNFIAAFGLASGTYNGKRGLVAENRIAMPTAWKALVENGKIKLWQVYADWSEGVKIITEDGQAD